ncbi:MAG: FKBP-type peptidyl-prolyl cis-trans isomerase [Desulfatiglandales bacterium]
MGTIQSDKAVTISYAMQTRMEDGSVKDHPEAALTFIFGVDCQVPALEKALAGRGPGDALRVEIPPSEIYGIHDPALAREIPKKGLIRQRLKQGQYYRQMKIMKKNIGCG